MFCSQGVSEGEIQRIRETRVHTGRVYKGGKVPGMHGACCPDTQEEDIRSTSEAEINEKPACWLAERKDTQQESQNSVIF